MFKPVSIYIGLRYTRTKRRNHFISFISLASMLGIALGVVVLITVLSVMNGFDLEIKKRIFGLTPQVTVWGTEEEPMVDWKPLGEKLLNLANVVSFAPFLDGQAMLTHDGAVAPVMIKGVVPDYEQSISELSHYFLQGSFNHLKPGEFGIVMGDELASKLDVGVGDRLNVLTAQAILSPVGLLPTMKRFTVVGLFHVGEGFGLDRSIVFTHLEDTQALFDQGQQVTGIQLKVKGLYDAIRVSEEAASLLAHRHYVVSNWTQDYGAYFHAIQMEKTMMFVLLLFIVAVAVFNLISTMVMVVTDKKAEIAILKTLGATPRMIMATFMTQGLLIGVIGVVLGLMGGVLLALNVTDIVTAIEHTFHQQFISANFYYINFLPSHLSWGDVWIVCLLALLMSFLATLYPAWQASRVPPAEALRYE